MLSVLSMLSTTTFLVPGLLLALLALPGLWWLLRMTPPPSRRQVFPAVRLLAELPQEEETPARTPWWLMALRLLIATLIIIALAHPVSAPGGLLSNRDGTILIVIDNGWASAPGWSDRQSAMDALLIETARKGRPVRLVTTAAREEGAAPEIGELLSAWEVRPLARALQPVPWMTDRAAVLRALTALSEQEDQGGAEVFWITDGLEESAVVDGASKEALRADEFATALQKTGPVTVLRPTASTMARTLTVDPDPTGKNKGGKLNFLLKRVPGSGRDETTLIAKDADGRILERQTTRFTATGNELHFSLEIPADVRNRLARVETSGDQSAASVFLLDERWRRRAVGLAAARGDERHQPLLSSHHYLQKALEPVADTRVGSIGELLQGDASVVVLADVGRVVGKDRTDLQGWVNDGGVLVRFAGPGLAETGDDFVPVRLRTGNRMLAGTMTWSTPLQLASFAANSPFHGLPVPQDVRVRQQVLAEPASNLGDRTWARLKDGTPIVTAERRGQGWLVLVHVTANGDWSDLPFSGLFVNMLERLINLAHGINPALKDGSVLPALQHLDAFGQLQEPRGNAKSLSAEDTVAPGRPPGFYGTANARQALNLGAHLAAPIAMGELPASITQTGLQKAPEVALKPALLVLAALLLLIDLSISLLMRGFLPGLHLRHSRSAGRVAVLLFTLSALLILAPRAWSQTTDDELVMAATLETRLAWYITGDADVDSMSQAGLTALTNIVRTRTSIEVGAPMGIDPEFDELAFYPLIYWPVTADMGRLSETALARIDAYLKNGGTILFDTRDQQYASIGTALNNNQGSATPERERLKRLLRRLDAPPLVPVPREHILTRAFYLMQAWPGRWSGGTVWVERHKGGVNDGVSSLIIGGHDWAAAWAVDETGVPLAAVVQESPRQREMASRFGVNLVMYVLTGNYKADQVHVPALLERLGQ